MYTDSVRFYDKLYHFVDYVAGAAKLHELIQLHQPCARTLLDVACGTGRHLEHLRRHYEVTGFDLIPSMLDLAKVRCPGVSFYQGSMCDFSLGQKFDIVTCLFSSIAYVRTIDNLNRTIDCLSQHLNPGGVLIVEPWFTPLTYWVGRVTANHFETTNEKITWMYLSERRDRLAILNIHYLVANKAGVRHWSECHELGLFTNEEYQSAFANAGCEVKYDPIGLVRRGIYVGRVVSDRKSTENDTKKLAG